MPLAPYLRTAATQRPGFAHFGAYHKTVLAAFTALLLFFGGTAQLREIPADALGGDPLVPRAASSDGIIAALQARLRERPADSFGYSTLGAAYLQKVREAGDPTYFPKAEAVLRKALDLDPRNFEAMISLGALSLARHQFEEAVRWAESARALNPYRAAIYGEIGDAYIESGEYDKGFDAFEKMMSLRPDLNSYARVAYARELSGDVAGAIEAMRLAADAGAPSSESGAWPRVQLGHLYFNYLNNLPAAEAEYQRALAGYPGYLYAIAGIARVRAAQRDTRGAIELYTRVTSVMPLPEFVIALGDVYQVSGHNQEAERQYALVRLEEQLFQANGVDTDLEMALFDADHAYDLPNALARARQQASRRPSIKAADVLAWALYQNGDTIAAQAAIQQALRLGTRDALMRFHAGMIAYRLGDSARARDFLTQALSINPNFSLLYADRARETLAGLNSGD